VHPAQENVKTGREFRATGLKLLQAFLINANAYFLLSFHCDGYRWTLIFLLL